MQFFMTSVSGLRQFRILFSAFFLIAFWASGQAQTSFVRISVVSFNPAKVHVEIASKGASNWSFRNTHAYIVGLAERIENFQGEVGREVPLKRLAPGEFRFSEPVTSVSYDVRLTPPANLAYKSRVSWLNEDFGLLMLRDLLPEVGMGRAPLLNLNFALPPEWGIASSGDANASAQYVVSRPESAVFLVGRPLHVDQKAVGTTKIKIVRAGDWPVSGKALTEIVRKIIEEHSLAVGHSPPANVALLLMPFDSASGPERWSAETTGENVVLSLGKEGSRGAVLSRLRVVLAHELFHLWVPNALPLEGDYDWFFEGFTLYQAMLTALRLHYISFNDYLDTIARVYDSYRSSAERDKLSLIEASERRWTTSASLVYDKGMLVALLFDLKVRSNSGNRTTVTGVYSGLFSEVTSNPPDANELIISMLNRHQGMNQFGREYIETAGQINLAQELEPYGLDVETTGSITEVKVRKTINSEQRQLLKALGYKK